jgi:hypothetical protein
VPGAGTLSLSRTAFLPASPQFSHSHSSINQRRNSDPSLSEEIFAAASKKNFKDEFSHYHGRNSFSSHIFQLLADAAEKKYLDLAFCHVLMCTFCCLLRFHSFHRLSGLCHVDALLSRRMEVLSHQNSLSIFHFLLHSLSLKEQRSLLCVSSSMLHLPSSSSHDLTPRFSKSNSRSVDETLIDGSVVLCARDFKVLCADE